MDESPEPSNYTPRGANYSRRAPALVAVAAARLYWFALHGDR
jgi:hypothetical protein